MTTKSKTKVELGDVVRDTISGFEGVVVCVSYWLNGCIRVQVEPRKLNDKGEMIGAAAFDIQQVELVELTAEARESLERLKPKEQAERPGGPRSSAPSSPTSPARSSSGF